MSRFVLTAQLQLQAPNNVAQVVRQIQSQLNNVNVNVQVQGAAQTQRQLQQVTAQTQAATTAADRMGRAFAMSIRRFAAFSIATRAVGLFTSTLSAAIQTSIDFEREMIRVSQVTGQAIGNLKFLTKAITDLSTGLGVSSKDLLQTGQLLLQAGVNAKDTEIALKTLARAALAPNFDSLSETTEGAIAILAQFGEGVGALERQLGAINAVAGAFAVEAGDLIDVVRRAGGVFKASGGDLNELIALFTSVRATTRESAESIGTGLRTIFTRIQRPKTIEFLKQFGVELVDMEGKFVGPYEAVKRLSAALAGLGEGDITFIRIAEELGGFRQIGKVLPLLQQFSTAQNALNVAQKAGNSLATDAATAQQALAIRIIKVKEEFLALIRGMTETSTFQIMANTALSLASALIKIGEAIKPLLPLLAAVAAVNIVKGMAGFAGGMLRGMQSGRTYSTGGKVHHFARGGMVPGTGNRDTVPAMLQPGEFVIRKSSVAKIGANNLAGMNKYAAGGIVHHNKFLYGTKSKWQDILKQYPQLTQNQAQRIANKTATPEKYGIQKPLTKKQKLLQAKQLSKERKNLLNQYPGGVFTTRPNSIGGFFLTPEKGSDGTTTLGKNLDFTLNDQKAVLVGTSTLKNYVPNRNDIKHNKLINNIVDANASVAIENAVVSASKTIGGMLSGPISIDTNKIRQSAIKIGSDKQVFSTMGGYMYEGIIEGLTGAKLTGGQANFDFPKLSAQNKSNLAAFFGTNTSDLSGLIKADAKRTLNNSMTDSIFAKVIRGITSQPRDMRGVKQLGEISTNTVGKARQKKMDNATNKHFGGIIQKFATGGGVGTDTVPALLTPGEFVVNRSSAQRIGYGNLNRMNKVGKYAKGGVVQGVQGFRFGGEVAQKNIADSFNREGYALVTSMTEVQKIFKQFVGDLTTLPNSVKKIISKVETFQLSKNDKFKRGDGEERTGDQIRGISLGGKVGINIGKAGTHTVKHEAAHEVDRALGGRGKTASQTEGTFQNKIATELQKTMAKEVGASAYRLDLAELFADTLAKVPPEVKKILVSTTDAAEGSKKLAAHFNKVGGPVAGLADLSADEFGGTQNKRSPAGNIPRTKAQSMGMSTADVLTAARSQAASARPASTPTNIGAFGAIPRAAAAASGGSSTQQNTQAVNQNTNAQKGAAKSAMDVVSNNKMFAASMATSLIAGFLPAVDENSGAMLKMTHSLLGLVTTITSVGFALEAFGLSMSAKGIGDFIGGGKGAMGSGKGFQKGMWQTGRGASVTARATGRQAGRFANNIGLGKFSGSISKVVTGFTNLLGPLMAVGGAAVAGASAFRAIYDSIYDFDGRLNDAIKAGDVEKAKSVVAEKNSFGNQATKGLGTIASGAAAGALAGSFVPIIGNALGAAIGAGVGALYVLYDSMGDSTKQQLALAAAQAGAVKTQKELDKAQKEATHAMEDFQNGSISASEALSKIRASSNQVVNQEKRASELAVANAEGRSTGAGAFLRNAGAYLGGGLFGMETASTRNRRLSGQSAEQINQAAKFQEQRFQMESGARSATIRSGFARGRDSSDIRKEAMGDLQQRWREQKMLGATLQGKGDEAGSQAAFEAAAQLEEQIKQVNREMDNLEKEVARAKAAFEAMDLGLRGPTATATAMSASMDRFSAGLEVGGNTFVANTQFLSQAMTSAAQAMDPEQIKSAIKDMSNNLSGMGIDPGKFEANTEAFIQAQQNYNQAFNKIRANIKANIEAGRKPGDTPDEVKKAFAEELTAGLGDEAKKNLTAIIENIPLSDDEVDKIIAGDLSVFGDKLSEAGQKQFEEIMKIAQERQKAEQVVIGLIRQRADAERNLAQAQKEATDLYMEGRDVQAKYGGEAVSSGERRAAIIAKANAGSGIAGVGAMRTGSVAELRQRQTQIVSGFGNIERKRSVDGGMAGTGGAKADEMQKNLDQAQKDQVETIRALIKLEEEELKIIQEKNKLEKDSLESLISGDIDKFFEQQAAVGAQAAIATGDMDAANMFGAQAVGDAFKDMQRQSEAGVQTMFGQRLGGAGGLLEQGASAALGARGVMDPRMAQRLAGTTAEEEAAKGRLQELGGLLVEAGAAQTAMAKMQVQTANINIDSAELKLSEIEERGRKAAANMYRGGPVYANRGIFVPRGTDTVPAMLTPGEFVVRREAVNRGNNLQLLRAINSGGNAGGFARGGKVGYYNNGGMVQYKAFGDLVGSLGKSIGIDPQMITNLGNIFNTFVNGFNQSIKNLQNTKVQIKMDSVNVNVNLTGGGMLNQISSQAKQEIMDQVVQKLKSEYGVGNDGKLKESPGNLPRPQ